MKAIVAIFMKNAPSAMVVTAELVGCCSAKTRAPRLVIRSYVKAILCTMENVTVFLFI
jgi:hypothetical protein